MPYLTAAQVAATVAAVETRSAPGSRLVVNYQVPSAKAGMGQLIGRLMMRLAGSPDPWSDEPHRSHWTPDQLSSLLQGHGFTTTHDRDLLEISSALGLPRRAGDLGAHCRTATCSAPTGDDHASQSEHPARDLDSPLAR